MGYSKIDDAPSVQWDDFRIFEAIAKTSSIKRAAATLGATQSALSKRLARLERSLGVRLVDRGPKGATLTFQGERVFTRVLAAGKELSRAAIDAQVADCRVEGDCSLTMGDGIANYWLTQFITQFLDRYQEIELKIQLDHDLGAAKNQIFDIRLHYYEPVDPSQVMRPLANVHFVPFAARSYLERFGTPSTTTDMRAHRFVDQTQHLVGSGSWSAWGGDEMLRRTVVFTNQSAFLAKCVKAGAGIALMPTYMAIVDPELVPLSLGVNFRARLFASYHRERASTQPVKTTLSFLRNVVFDPKSMPWFEEEFRFPQLDWPDRLNAARQIVQCASAA